MSMGIALFALVVGFMAGSGGAVGALSLWSGRRVHAAGLVGFGLVSVLGSLAVLGVVLGLWLVWALIRGRLSSGNG